MDFMMALMFCIELQQSHGQTGIHGSTLMYHWIHWNGIINVLICWKNSKQIPQSGSLAIGLKTQRSK